MYLRACVPLLLATLVLCAAAQTPAAPAQGGTGCTAQVAALEQAMATARAKGQMLRRQQLANELAALRAQCQQGVVEPDREARIAQLEQEIRELRAQLDRAEEQLRKLKADAL